MRAVIDFSADSGCWEWCSARDKDGYGRCAWLGSTRLPHRVLYEQVYGPIPEGLELDHLCRNRACVRPDHLEVVTHAENVRRGAPAQQTECANGHVYDEANTYIRPNGRRDCRSCIRARGRDYKARRAA